MMELSMEFWKKALGVGGVVTVALAMMWSIYGEAIDKVSPIGAEASLIILGMMVMFVFLVVGKIIDNKHKEAMEMHKKQEELERYKQKAKAETNTTETTIDVKQNSKNITVGNNNNNPQADTEKIEKKKSHTTTTHIGIGGNSEGDIMVGDGNNTGKQ